MVKLIVILQLITAYGLPINAENSVVVELPDKFKSHKECMDKSSRLVVELIKSKNLTFDWRVMTCTDGKVDAYRYPNYNKKKQGLDV